ncbi:hypothetical protein NA57DRAFT_49700 [Rhizodiscina lignyota]|uniref:Uncharacterized protein n=1 Tax=Rhizodiscina lignyota TaxID=1504668 RepID=A0A9P4I0H2_9PEZI|nr:hypothetical protein NA57DRAFT_49700 [Rhizodiscina lignyota]
MGNPNFDDKSNVAIEIHPIPDSTYHRLSEEPTTNPNRRTAVHQDGHTDWWQWELVGVTVSLACLAAIMGLLAHLDDKPQPEWARHMCIAGRCKSVSVAVNSVISWLSTVAKICVLLPITRGLAQLKWVWFAEEPRQLKDMDTFESASRGLTGSAMLLWKLKGRHIAAVGALAVILSLGFDPFIQNLVTYGTQPYNNGTQIAYVTNATTYTIPGITDANDIDIGMKTNIYAATFASDPNEAWGTPLYSCPTGNCKWDTTLSLGVCARCTDLSSQLKMNCSTESDSPTFCDTHSTYSNIGAFPLLWTKSIAAYDTEYIKESTPLVANECILFACMSVYNATVDQQNVATGPALSGSVYTENVIEVFENFTGGPGGDMTLEIGPLPGYGLHTRRTFSIEYETQRDMNTYFNGFLSGRASRTPSGSGWIFGDAVGGPSDLMQAIYENQNLDCFPENPKDKVACAMENIARAATKSMRDASVLKPGVNARSANFTGAGIAVGQVFSPTIFIHVQWPWIILPALVWVMSCIMFIGTAWKTRRAGVKAWRTSPLALVFLGLDQDAAEKVRQHGLSGEGLVKKAEDLQVQMHIGEHEARLVSR